jgi:hypothetical protein
MNLKTTFILLICIAVGAAGWLVFVFREGRSSAPQTQEVLPPDLASGELTRIEVTLPGGKRLELQRGTGEDWTLPGNWPTHKAEVDQLVQLLTNLRSRFAPLPLEGEPPDLKKFGLDPSQSVITVTLDSGAAKHDLHFGEEPGDSNRFSRPTFVRVDQEKDVRRLGPGLVAILSRPPDFYQQRRLFPAEFVKEGDSQERAERLAAKAVKVKGPSGTYTLTKKGADWELDADAFGRDRPDPDKLKTIMAKVPDIWAEQFVDKGKKDLKEMGLAEPEQTVVVTRPSGETVTLLIGKQSQMKTRKVSKPAPPGPPGMPRMPQQEVVHDEYRYAKLENNEQIFEIKADPFKDIFVDVDTLRDTRLARFRSEDARKLEITYDGQDIVLEKDKDRWKLRKPVEADAESSKVQDLLDKLSNLQTSAKEDIIDKADLKAYSLEPAVGTIKVKVEESKGEGDNKTKTEKIFTFALGKDDTAKKKLYVRVEDWPRISAVEDSVVALAKRPVLAYRGRRVLDFLSGDLAKIEVQRGDEKFVFQQDQNNWKLAAPVQAEVDRPKVDKLADDLGRLEAVEYVSDAPPAAELENVYGLSKPSVSATVTFSKADKPTQTLLVGKQRGDKPEYFAKLASAPSVFVVSKPFYDDLNQGSLAYRPLQLWQLQAGDVTDVRSQKDGKGFHLKREGLGWRILEPFDANAMANLVGPLLAELTNLRADRYEAHTAKDLGTYGLDKPYLRLAVTTTVKKEGGEGKDAKEAKEEKTEHVLLIGKPTAKDTPTRYAKLGNSEGVVVVGGKLTTEVDRTAFDFLNRNLLTLDAKSITGIKSVGSGDSLTLVPEKDTWQVKGGTVQFSADPQVMDAYVQAWSNLQADRFVDYGPKADLAAYGLDHPARTITVTVNAAEADKEPKTTEHMLIVGKPAADQPAGSYARLDKEPGIFVLPEKVAAELKQTYLDFVDRTVLKFDGGAVTSITRKMGNDDLEIAKHADGWQLVKPATLPADAQTVEELVKDLASLRAVGTAAYPAADLKPFGLDNPSAIVTVRLTATAGKPAEQILRLGNAAAPNGGTSTSRYAVANDSKAVALLDGGLASRLLSSPLSFRDRNLAQFAEVDRVQFERGPRKAVFTKVNGTWKLTSPLGADAEHGDLEDFVNVLARLRADQLVADKPADLKPYGLDKPLAQWRFYSGDKEVLGLLVGSYEAGKGPVDQARRYAKLTTKDLVFLLDPGLSKRVLAEYRGRSIWGPLDAAQVETLEYKASGRSFTLQKRGTSWHVAGQPMVAVKTEAVSETLDALARLKAERYVVDKDADLKLYGLEPPLLTVDILTPAGKRTLEIGRAEGDSKRHYARVPEANHTEVFIIAEADADRIIRDLAAFTQKPAKDQESKAKPMSP